jgi:hypothetical protein
MKSIYFSILIVGFGILFAAILVSNSGKTPNAICADFKTQAQAQQALNTGLSQYSGLDGDEDGVACENLPRR